MSLSSSSPSSSSLLPLLSSSRLHLLTLNNLGVLIGYAAQSNLGTSELLRHGMSPAHIPLAFLAGPISSLVIQPFVGHVSDQLGRRRPFILFGACGVSLSLFALASSHVVLAFFALDISLSSIQAPVRATLTDAIHPAQRPDANAKLSMYGAAGGLITGGLAAMPWGPLRKIMRLQVDAQVVLIISGILAFISILPCALLAPEPCAIHQKQMDVHTARGKHDCTINDDDTKQLFQSRSNDNNEEDDDQNQHDSHDNDLEKQNTKSSFRSSTSTKDIDRQQTATESKPMKWTWPRPFWQTFAVQLCTWCGVFALSVYGNAWVGTQVFGGDGGAEVGSPDRLKFEAGVRLGSFAQALGAMTSFVVSFLVIPRVHRVRPIYITSQLVETLSLCTPLLLGRHAYGKKFEAVIAIVSFGVVSAVTNCIPWLIMAEGLQSDPSTVGRVGVYTTTFNVCQAFPQLVLGVVSPMLLKLFNGEQTKIMAVAGALGLLGAVLIVVLKVDVLENGEQIVLGASEQSSDGEWDTEGVAERKRNV